MFASREEIDAFKDAAFNDALIGGDPLAPARASALQAGAFRAARDAWWLLATIRNPELIAMAHGGEASGSPLPEVNLDDERPYLHYTLDQLRLEHACLPSDEHEEIWNWRGGRPSMSLERFARAMALRAIKRMKEGKSAFPPLTRQMTNGNWCRNSNWKHMKSPIAEMLHRSVTAHTIEAFEDAAMRLGAAPVVMLDYIGTKPRGTPAADPGDEHERLFAKLKVGDDDLTDDEKAWFAASVMEHKKPERSVQEHIHNYNICYDIDISGWFDKVAA